MKPSRIDLLEINHAVGRDFGLNETHRYLVSLHNVFLHGVELALLEISLWWNSILGEEEERWGGGGEGIHDLAPSGTSQTDHSYRVLSDGIQVKYRKAKN